MKKDDDFARLIRCLPRDFSDRSIEQLLVAKAEADPSYWLSPISAAVAADFLSTSVDALTQMRVRGKGPEYVKDGTTVRYLSRLELIHWVRSQPRRGGRADA